MMRALVAALVVLSTIAFAPAGVAAMPADDDKQCGDYHIPEDQNCDGEVDDEFDNDDDASQGNEDCDTYHVPEDRDCDGEIDPGFESSDDGGNSGDSIWATLGEVLNDLL